MEKIKFIKRQDSGLKLSAGNSGETSLNLSNEIFDFLSNNAMSLGEEKQLTFKIFREDYLKALGFIILKMPLYKSSSNSSEIVNDIVGTFQGLNNEISTYFGDSSIVDYPVTLFYRPDGRIYLKGLRRNNFSIRDYLVENHSAIKFTDENGSLNLRVLSNVTEQDFGTDTNTDDELSVLDKNLPQQQIYFGTPGSGKSHKVKDLVEMAYPNKTEREKYVFRTTFHPDSDYASFVGCYKPQMNDDKITYNFVPQAFTKAYVQAWNNPEKSVYLIVEEINRGNCAQIFGDLFQLLDRKGGESEYPIEADDDLRQHLEKELNEAGKAGITNGKIRLPKNLNILATMNTSDQSLFPMDSAFKRRWTWECVPIDYNNPKSGAFIISLGDKKYNWHEFLKKVNELIRKATDSEDKQMGNFFIDGDVDESQFVNKVMFYLWNDVCKEEFGTKNNFFRYYTDNNGIEKEFSFNDLFSADAHNILVKFMVHIGFKDDDKQPNNEETETDGE